MTTRTTPVSRRRHPYNRRRKAWATSALHQLAETGASRWPQCIPPEHLCLAPSRRGLLRPSRCPRPGCVPPLTVARFEQRFLNGYGPAQVGFGLHVLPPFQTLPFVYGITPVLNLVLSPAAHAQAEGDCVSGSPWVLRRRRLRLAVKRPNSRPRHACERKVSRNQRDLRSGPCAGRETGPQPGTRPRPVV